MIAIIAGLAVTAGVLTVRGYFYGSTAIVRDATINAKPERIWCYITMPDARVLWEPGLTDVVSLEAPDVVPVTRWLLIMRSAGKSYEVEEDVVESKSRVVRHTRRIADRYKSELLISLSTNKGQTHLEYSERVVFEKLIDRILAPYFGVSWSGKIRQGLARLADLTARKNDLSTQC